ncbi:MAG: hypothetical protein J4A00_00690 [Gammaproteobacteria bacterium]|nr:hypothetical protein [Gammaproteobacteria bacterium]
MTHGGRAGALFELFNLSPAADMDLPVAAVTAVVDLAEAAPGYWLRADPVCLQATRDQLLLAGARSVGLDLAEAGQLAATVAAFLAEEQLELFSPDPFRWYLRLPGSTKLQTTPLSAIEGGAIEPHLPRGDDAMNWCRRMNELQMLLHHHPVNLARAEQDRYPVNSLWFWGGGSQPRVRETPWQQVVSNDPLAVGLAQLGGRKAEALPEDLSEWLRCWLDSAPTGPALLLPEIDQLQQTTPLMTELHQALGSGVLDQLEIWQMDRNRRQITAWDRASLRPWWRFW